MLNAIRVLVGARLLIARNTFWRGKIGRKVLMVVLAVGLVFAAYGIYWLMRSAVSWINSQRFADALAEAARLNPGLTIPSDVGPYLLALPSLVLFFALILMILTSFTTVLSSLYLSGDLDMLLVAPVPMRAVFIVKFFGGLIVPYALLFFLLGPALVGYGVGMGFGAAFFVVAVLVLALLPLLPAGLGALLVMAVVRVIPARRAREIVSVIGGLFGASWYILNQFAPQVAPRLANIRTLESLRQLDLPLLPSAWAGRALIAAGQGEWLTLLVYGGLFVGLSVAIFAGCLVLAERLYYAGWSNMATQGGRVRRRKTQDEGRRSAESPLIFRLASFILPSQSVAIFYKDLRVFPRDLRNLQQIIFPLALAGIWTFQLVSGGSSAEGGRAAEMQQVLSTVGSAGISFFVCLSLSGALGGPSISREGKGFWLLRIAPISTLRVLLGKLALAYLPFPVVGTAFVLLLTLLRHAPPLDFLRSLALVLVVGLGTSSISLGMGAAFPRFDWENPRKQLTLRAGCLSPVLYLAYVVVALGIIFGLPALALLAPNLALVLTVVSWLLLLGLTALVVWGSLTFGAARLDQVELA
jgi:ABC-2 type transport system permease protein